MISRVTVIVLCCLACVVACTPTALKPVADPGFIGFENDDVSMQTRAAEQAKRIDESGFLYSDPELEAYLNAVARKLEPAAVYEQIPFRVKVLRDPMLSAFALANGSVYLLTGILASIENEAQLAVLLGHEMTHVTNRHAVRQMRDLKNKTNVFSALFLATGGLASVFGPVAQASVMGYTRDMEREADVEGFRLAGLAGYDTAESLKLFEALKRQIEEEKIEESYFFGSHPRIMERIESFQALISAKTMTGPSRITNAESFQQHVKKLLLDNTRLQMQTGRYEWSASALQSYIERYPNEAVAWFLLGEANRQQGGDYVKKAEEAYQKALSLDESHADAHKMLGIILMKAGNMTTAREHLERYLAINAAASDRAYIEGYIKECEK